MRRFQVWSIALKDLADFRTSKYAMYSIVIPPLLMGIFLPLFYAAQFQALIGDGQNDLQLGGVQPYPGDPSGTVITLAYVRDVDFSDAKLNASVVENATLTRVFVEGSLLRNVTLVDSVVFHCNLEGSVTVENTTMIGSAFTDRPNPDEDLAVFFLVNILLLMLMIIPAMVPTVLASYSLVGEKVAGSLEPLLATPSTDAEILAGKVTAILIPTLAVCWISGVLSVVLVQLAASEIFRRHPLPLDQFAAALVVFVPAFALVSILSNVIVSSRVTDVRAAQQIGGVIVLPVVFLFILSLAGLQTLGLAGILITSGVVLGADIALSIVCVRMFKREEILVRWK